jgi:hypothetical protein
MGGAPADRDRSETPARLGPRGTALSRRRGYSHVERDARSLLERIG